LQKTSSKCQKINGGGVRRCGLASPRTVNVARIPKREKRTQITREKAKIANLEEVVYDAANRRWKGPSLKKGKKVRKGESEVSEANGSPGAREGGVRGDAKKSTARGAIKKGPSGLMTELHLGQVFGVRKKVRSAQMPKRRRKGRVSTKDPEREDGTQ